MSVSLMHCGLYRLHLCQQVVETVVNLKNYQSYNDNVLINNIETTLGLSLPAVLKKDYQWAALTSLAAKAKDRYVCNQVEVI